MIPGMAEAGTGIKAGSAIIQAMSKKTALPQWPNMHESLIALHEILTEWCVAAAGTSGIIFHEKVRRRDPGVENLRDEMQANVAGQYVAEVRGDIAELMQPKLPFYLRWWKARRRAAARRGLRSLLRVYFPDVLTEFIKATEDRAEFARRNHDLERRIMDYSNEELDSLEQEADGTRRALVTVTEGLAQLINENFPLGPVPVHPIFWPE
jgi:hypothetical protein